MSRAFGRLDAWSATLLGMVLRFGHRCSAWTTPLNADGYPAWMPGVHAHALALAGRGKDEQQQMVRASFIRKHLRNYKRRGQCIFLRYFNLLVEKGTHFGEISRLDCSRLALHSLCMVCYGGLPLGRTRAHFQYANQLEQAGILEDVRRCCLFCLNRGVCVLDSEWHFMIRHTQ